MIGAQVAEFFQRVGKGFRRLVRDAEHHVGAEIRKARRPRRAEGFREIRKAVKPPERAQLARLRALQTHAQAVEAAFPQLDKIPGRDRSRVAFGCNLGILCHIVAGQNRCEKPAKHLGRQTGRRSAAEVDRIHCIVAAVLRPHKEIALHRGGGTHPLLRRVRNRAEIAVQAFAAAERNMQIKSERRHTVTPFFLLYYITIRRGLQEKRPPAGGLFKAISATSGMLGVPFDFCGQFDQLAIPVEGKTADP